MFDYERIWLQYGAETTWCKDRINDDDVEYVRADIAAAAIERLTQDRDGYMQIVMKQPATIERLTRERDEAMEDAKTWKYVASERGSKQAQERSRAAELAAELAKARGALTKCRYRLGGSTTDPLLPEIDAILAAKPEEPQS